MYMQNLFIFGIITMLSQANEKDIRSPDDLEIHRCTSYVNRHRRDTPSEPKPHEAPDVEVHHHYYYYCSTGHGAARPQVVGGQDHPEARAGCAPDCRCTQGGKCTCKDPAGSVSCGCDMRGSCSCKVAEDVLGKTGGNGRSSGHDGEYNFNALFEDSVGKEFFDFISKRFVETRKDKDSDKRFPYKFNDNVCNEFLKLLEKIIKRKSKPNLGERNVGLPREFLTLLEQSRKRNKESRRTSSIKFLINALQQEVKDALSDVSGISDSISGSIDDGFLGF